MGTEEEPLEALLRRVGVRVEDAVAGEERVRALLDAVTAVGRDLDLHSTLERIASAAARLAGAQYSALGVLDREGEGLIDFLTYGIDEETTKKIGPLPRGHGILGLLISDPRPLRLHDLTQHANSYGFPENHPPMTCFLGVPVRVRDRVFGNLYLTDKDGGGDFTDEDEHSVVALAAAAGVAIENAELYGRAQRRERWLGATAEIQHALISHMDRHTALSLVAARAREVTAADLAVVVLEQPGGDLRVEAVDGSDGSLQDSVLPREGDLADVVDRGATVHLTEGARVPGLVGMESALLVPFAGQGGAGGALVVGAMSIPWGRWLGDDDVTALSGFASQAALVLDRIQAQEDRAHLAVLADRERIARDLHDLVMQRLFATGLTLQGISRRAQAADVTDRLQTAVSELDATIRDLRGAIFELGRDGEVTDFRGQIRDVASAAVSTLNTQPRLVLEGPLDTAVPDVVRPHLIAVLVEALSNVGRHAHASQVDVRVAVGTGEDAEVVLEVRDDGVGFEEAERESGIKNIRDRAEGLGGTCVVDSELGRGTSVLWRVPVTGIG